MIEYTATPEMQDLSDQIGEFVYYWGFKRIHGKMWTHLFLAKKPLDAADFVKQMKISKALVSISLRELIEFDVMQVAGKSERGTQLYKTNPDIMSVILSVLRQREKRMLARVQTAQETMLKASDGDREQMGISGQNLIQLGELVARATSALDSFIALRPVDFSDWGVAFNMSEMSTNGIDADGAAKSLDGLDGLGNGIGDGIGDGIAPTPTPPKIKGTDDGGSSDFSA